MKDKLIGKLKEIIYHVGAFNDEKTIIENLGDTECPYCTQLAVDLTDIFSREEKFKVEVKEEPKDIREDDCFDYKEEYKCAVNEVKELYSQLKDAENEIRQLENELRNS